MKISTPASFSRHCHFASLSSPRSWSPFTPSWSHSRLGSQPDVGLTPLSIHLPYFPIPGVKLIFALCSRARPTNETFGNFRKPKKQKWEIRCSETRASRWYRLWRIVYIMSFIAGSFQCNKSEWKIRKKICETDTPILMDNCGQLKYVYLVKISISWCQLHRLKYKKRYLLNESEQW